LIDRLVEDGFLLRDLDHEFKLIRLTKQGAAAEAVDLIAYDEVIEQPGQSRVTREPVSDEGFSPEDDAVVRRLHDWRRERAVRDAVPAYVVAPNATLLEIAQRRPGTPDELAEIKGFGPTRVEKYGAEIFAVLSRGVSADLPEETQTALY
jgi:superfamily II DNA helicase RecQ